MDWAIAAGWPAAVGIAALARRAHARSMEAIARSCHELRGPLTAARLGLALGRRGGGLPDGTVRAIDLELERAALAVEDLAGARRGRLIGSLRRRPSCRAADVDLQALVADSVEGCRAAAGLHGACLGLRWSGGAALVRGDRVRLAQATGNLLANAVEHGGGLIEVRGAGDGTTVRLEVIDGGPGLPAPVAALARRARAGRGARGRGLANAAAIAEEHGGRLAAAPSERGARLVLELPACDCGSGGPSGGARDQTATSAAGF